MRTRLQYKLPGEQQELVKQAEFCKRLNPHLPNGRWSRHHGRRTERNKMGRMDSVNAFNRLKSIKEISHSRHSSRKSFDLLKPTKVDSLRSTIRALPAPHEPPTAVVRHFLHGVSMGEVFCNAGCSKLLNLSFSNQLPTRTRLENAIPYVSELSYAHLKLAAVHKVFVQSFPTTRRVFRAIILQREALVAKVKHLLREIITQMFCLGVQSGGSTYLQEGVENRSVQAQQMYTIF